MDDFSLFIVLAPVIAVVWMIEDVLKRQSLKRQVRQIELFNRFLFNWSAENENGYEDFCDYPPDWFVRRQVVIVRDSFCCRQCGRLLEYRFVNNSNWEDWSKKEEIDHRSGYVVQGHVHHIKPLKSGGSNMFSNLILLCEECHSLQPNHKTIRKNYLAKKFRDCTRFTSVSRFTKRKARKQHTCIVCESSIESGDDYYYSKLALQDQEKKLCANCVSSYGK